MAGDQSTEPQVEALPIIGEKLKRGLFVAAVLSIAVYGGMLLYLDAGAIQESLSLLTVEQVLLLAFVSSLNFVFRFGRWEFYLARLGLKVQREESVLVFLAGFAMSVSPGKLGEVLKSLMLKASMDVAVARTAPIVLAERVTDVAALVLLGAWGLGVSTGAWWLSSLLLAGVVMLAAIVGSRPLGLKVAMLVSTPTKLRRLRAKLIEMLDALRDLVTPKAYVLGTIFGLFAWGAHGATLMLAANMYPGVELTNAEAQVAHAAPLIAGTLAMLPGGVGLTEASMTGALMQAGGPGATAAVAASVTIVVRVVTFWLAIGIGVFALGLWRYKHRAVHVVSEVEPDAGPMS